MKVQSTPPTTTAQLPQSLRYIVAQLEGQRQLKPANVRRIIIDAGVEPVDLQAWADFDHPVEDSYGRKLVYKGDNFEIMVMSWRPGDFSAIHDHGYTQWGAVQVFGPAEHATFRMEDDFITTLSRQIVKPYDVLGVSHSLLHQMGNPTSDTFFFTLHVYGELEDIENVTGEARVIDLENNTIQRVDGGVFYALPASEIVKIEEGPVSDFPTKLRHTIELIRRLRKMENRVDNKSDKNLQALLKDFSSAEHRKQLLTCLRANTDEDDHESNSMYWKVMNWELKEAAKLQNELRGEVRSVDAFHKYATLYDELICQPCLNGFMAGYLQFFKDKYNIDFPASTFISLGAGTGLVEEFLIKEMGIDYKNLYGIDISEAMVTEARKRIQADQGDVLKLDPSVRLWDVAFSGLNVFHYLDHTRLEEAIQKTAAILKPGGHFVGDFITPDHIRWYPNVMYSADQKVVSLRSPRLVEDHGAVFQESEIININFLNDQMEVSYAGKHMRFLPPVMRIRTYFEKAFGGQVDLYDAVTLEPISEWADSCSSTRYVVVAQKK